MDLADGDNWMVSSTGEIFISIQRLMVVFVDLGGLGGTKAAEADDDAEQTRRQQGYGAGSGVGG
ncbi:MAG: hypothetical protein M1837_005525 [Sclerophora amabilis]|nr:MAG: hypothetical protein M1837_005525 [Sclerophora amabilis]